MSSIRLKVISAEQSRAKDIRTINIFYIFTITITFLCVGSRTYLALRILHGPLDRSRTYLIYLTFYPLTFSH